MARDDPKRPQTAPASRPLPPAWQPLTWRGVAAFAPASLNRLVLTQTVVALLAVASVTWFLRTGWFPVIREAIRQLPETGVIEHQELRSPRTSTDPLVETRLLTFVIDVDGVGTASLSSDLRVEFHRSRFAVCSLLGCCSLTYPRQWNVQFNRPELQSWWGAWETMLYISAALAVFLGLFVSWIILAAVYSPLLRIYAFFKDRELSLAGSWRLASAALLPGSLLVAGGLLLYGLGWIDLPRFLALWLLHFPLSWVYLIVSPRRLPPASDAWPGARRNPFGDEKEKAGPTHPFGPGERERSNRTN